jgi:ribonucleoside-triphosphate reductase
VKDRAENAASCPTAAAPEGKDGLFLFTTKTCPNCKTAKSDLEAAGISYHVVDVEEHRDLAKKYGILQAPTLIVRSGDEVQKLVNASNIREFVQNAQ